MPEYTKNTFLTMPYLQQVAAVCEVCADIISRELEAYEPQIVYAERQSLHADDWYLWTIVARQKATNTNPEPSYTCWTLNLSRVGFYHGHYQLGIYNLTDVINQKKIRS